MVKITVLTAAALAAGLIAACGGPASGVATPHAPATPGVVAWVDQPAAQVPVVLRSPPYSTGARPCRPADLSVSHGELGYATGHTSVEVYLTSHSATACWLDGYPAIAGVAADGAVTRRIIAHVTRGWPRLGEPIVHHRGRFCYVSAFLPGHRELTPILRLRYQGSADRWAIGIYLASSGQYTESELPASFGPQTGTPEQGVDDTFVLYAGPRTDR
jgi:Domain of unknown function (DUF4232)